uniref:Glucosylceramidase n=1 Tax=Meloidogyne enterolobii TaxID=390850 RepID=A0A6V7WN29_MELEN|nr:unnamed protein product [Meloidogyne enterolobii]
MQLLRTYFDKNIGIRYSVGRVPISSCDFSSRVYSYCDTDNDFKLKTFALAEEDLHMKIPHILTANLLAGSPLNLVATSWSAPAWMKTSRKMPGGGSLRGKLDGPFYHTYTHYLRR